MYAKNLRALFARLPIGLVFLLLQMVDANLPYNPTNILSASDTVYILDPASDSLPQGQLRSFKTNSNLNANSLSTSTIGTLPWYQSTDSVVNSALAYTPVLDSDGGIAVVAGNCAAGVDGSSLYKYTPSSGKWSNSTLTNGAPDSKILVGASFMSSAVSFSPNMAANEMDFYMFGGMCPFANSTANTWMTSATYSDSLLQVQEKTTGDTLYVVNQNSPSPIAEAGFTFTPLQATYSNSSSGVHVVGQDFLLLGGHTDGGFMNMSLIAVLAMPQASWTFVSVDSPNDKTELIKRDDNTVTPRSGHTSVLSADGTQIIIVGGWVGDVTTPASPQLAILDVGVGYGGNADWIWSVPSTSGSPFASGQGIYGHGATLLPGNVLLVTGGFSIPSSSSSKTKRQAALGGAQSYLYNITANNWISDYDADEAAASESAAAKPAPSSSRNPGLGVGLAVGLLGLLLAGWLVWWYWRRYKKTREEHHEQMSERHQSEYSGVLTGPYGSEYVGSSHGRSSSSVPEEMRQTASVWGRPKSRENWPWMTSEPAGLDAVGSETRDAERTGLDVDFPSPERGLRQAFKGRGGYHSAPRCDFEDSRPSRAYGDMYAIEELSEHESNPSSRKTSRTVSHQHAGSPLIATQTALDPFRDPDGIDGHHPPAVLQTAGQKPLRHMPSNLNLSMKASSSRSRAGTFTSAEQRRLEMTQWVQDWEHAESVMQRPSPTRSQRSMSPDKSDRTMSDLSEQSLLSVGSINRQQSTRSVVNKYFPGLISKSNSSASTNHSGSNRSDGLSVRRSRPKEGHQRVPSGGAGPSESIPGFGHLQSESEALLGRSPSSHPRRSPSRQPVEPDSHPTFTSPTRALSTTSTQTTKTTSSANRSRHGGFAGSFRRAVLPRALSFGSLAGNRSASLTRAGGRPLAGVINDDGYYEYRDDVDERHRKAGHGPGGPATRSRSSASSPTKHDDDYDNPHLQSSVDDASAWGASTRKAIVRRSVSDSGPALWAIKRGKDDWSADGAGESSMPEPIPRPSARGLFTGRNTLAPSNAKTASISTTGATRGASSSRSRSRSRLRVPQNANVNNISSSSSGGADGSSSSNGASRPNTGRSGRSGQSGRDDDWDVEEAVQGRCVQVMFTVPRAKLRVVNADVLDAERDSYADEGGLNNGGAGGATAGGPSSSVAGPGINGPSGSVKKDKGKGRLVERESEIFKRYDGSGWA